MVDPTLQPLAALLASHPAEVEAVVAVLCVSEHDVPSGLSTSRVAELVNFGGDGSLLLSILRACVEAGCVRRSASWPEYSLSQGNRMAIARMGAAAWLRARLSVKPTTIERMSAAFDHLAAINVVADGLPELERDAVEQARLRLFVALDGTAHAKRGIPEYGEDEVRERGAQAPKGEQR